jgi:DNA modification methylase
MPTLNWIGKEKVINHHRDVPFRILEHKYGFNDTEGETQTPINSGNKIIHGDNLEALKSLLPEYEGKIKCIYIDPPYNTGNESWVYNDNVNHPKLKKWLEATLSAKQSGSEAVVGIDDLARHDKWLCMMYPRLKLLHQLLSNNGVIFISIDDNELHHLQVICDELFGASNKLGIIIWKNVTDNNPTNISVEHEYIICYANNRSKVDPIWKSSNSSVKDKLIEIGDELISIHSDPKELQRAYTEWFKENKPFLWPLDRYKYIDKNGVYTGSQSVHNPGKEGYRYDVFHPKTNIPCKEPLMGYRFPQTTMIDLLNQEKILFGEDHTKIIELKVYAKDYKAKLPSVINLDGRLGAYELRSIFPEVKKTFDNPKTVQLIEELLSFSTKADDTILDSFAGSGTTAHSVLNLNKIDGGSRKFILVEMEDYANTITAERVKRVINGYAGNEGTGGSFDYYELGKPLFVGDNSEYLNEEIDITKIREYIWYSETRTAYKQTEIKNDSQYFLGKKEGTAYYFIYEKDSITTLDYDTLATIKTKAGQYVIYADNCLLPKDFMLKKNIVFKKIPRDITRF